MEAVYFTSYAAQVRLPSRPTRTGYTCFVVFLWNSICGYKKEKDIYREFDLLST